MSQMRYNLYLCLMIIGSVLLVIPFSFAIIFGRAFADGIPGTGEISEPPSWYWLRWGLPLIALSISVPTALYHSLRYSKIHATEQSTHK